jgi:hypothetical protein
MRKCRRIWCSQKSHKWRHNMAHTSCMLDKQGYMHACNYTRPCTRAHVRTPARVYPRICNTYCFSIATYLNVTLYVHCLSCLCFNYSTSELLVSVPIRNLVINSCIDFTSKAKGLSYELKYIQSTMWRFAFGYINNKHSENKPVFYSVVGTVVGYGLDDMGFETWPRQAVLPFSKPPTQTPSTTQPPIQCV